MRHARRAERRALDTPDSPNASFAIASNLSNALSVPNPATGASSTKIQWNPKDPSNPA
ncbi:hypothetical protein BSIN_3462 [Burkholderia singularis]|uniref:Uncharacterized protein n=1 Tax=Burkholderia singularis TaxID=1503053 RepID=A0A238HBH7_9BURK|nr:hypothetical protein BSIN_3462 [Burkholderia singularis]